MDQQLKKHSACDECRARKLRCSGCSSGCERCRRDKVACVYSTQKPMGRPRKRRRSVDPTNEETRYSPVGLSVVEVPRPFVSHIVAHQDNAETRMFMNEFEWLNNDPDYGTGNLGGLPPFLGEIAGNYPQPSPPPRTSVVIRRTRICDDTLPPFHLREKDTSLGSVASGAASYFPGLDGEAPLLVPCSCLSSFFATISTLRIPPPVHSVSLPYAIQTSNSALLAARNSFSCESCHANAQSNYITNMLLGIQLPLLCQFFSRVLTSINATTDPQYVIMGDGQGIQLDVESWQVVARTAIRKEARKVLDLTEELERMTALCHGVPVAKVGNLADQSGNEPLCIRVLKTIRAVAEYIVVR